MLYFIPYSYSIMTFSFILFTYHLLHPFLYGSISFSHSLFVSFSLSSSFTFPKALSFFSLRLSVSVSVSYTLLFLPSSCSSPEAFLFFSFLFSSLFMAVTVRAAVTLQTGFAAHTLTVCFQSFDPTTVNQPLS